MSIGDNIKKAFGFYPVDEKTSKKTDKSTSDASSMMSSSYNTWTIVGRLRDLNDNYKYKYLEYDYMAEDTIIQSALELYADDSTQLDTNTKRVVEVASKDKTLQKDLEAFLESIEIEDRIWTWAYDLAKNGDVFLKVHNSKSEVEERNLHSNAMNEDYMEPSVRNLESAREEILRDKKFRISEVEDPSEVMDLWLDGERVAYAEEYRREEAYQVVRGSLNLYIVPKDRYVHMMIRSSSKTDKIDIDRSGEIDENGNQVFDRYSVLRGTSMLEGVRSIYRILQLLEDSLLSAKISKAEFTRVFNIEVGDDTPGRTTETVNRVKNLFDNKASFNKYTGRYTSNKQYRPVGDPVFNPVRNGKGSISHEDIGGNLEVKDITDLDYFNNKFFAGLKIPKAYLGFEESLPGGLGDNTLSRLDIRYSRSVRRIQKPLIQGIKDLCILWGESNNRVIKDTDFDIIIQAPSSSEELSRLAELDMRVNSIDRVASSISGIIGEYVNMPKIFSILFENYIDYPELKDDLLKEIKRGVKARDKDMNPESIQQESNEDSYDSPAHNPKPVGSPDSSKSADDSKSSSSVTKTTSIKLQ